MTQILDKFLCLLIIITTKAMKVSKGRRVGFVDCDWYASTTATHSLQTYSLYEKESYCVPSPFTQGWIQHTHLLLREDEVTDSVPICIQQIFDSGIEWMGNRFEQVVNVGQILLGDSMDWQWNQFGESNERDKEWWWRRTEDFSTRNEGEATPVLGILLAVPGTSRYFLLCWITKIHRQKPRPEWASESGWCLGWREGDVRKTGWLDVGAAQKTSTTRVWVRLYQNRMERSGMGRWVHQGKKEVREMSSGASGKLMSRFSPFSLHLFSQLFNHQTSRNSKTWSDDASAVSRHYFSYPKSLILLLTDTTFHFHVPNCTFPDR